jgi:hypothetical protein
MFSKCNVSLMAMTNKLSEEISVIIKKALGMESGEFSGGRGANKEEGGASGSGASGEITINLYRKAVSDTGTAAGIVFHGVMKLFKLYMNYKIPPDASRVGILILFMVFITAIIRRKEIDSCGNIIYNRRKIRISA